MVYWNKDQSPQKVFEYGFLLLEEGDENSFWVQERDDDKVIIYEEEIDRTWRKIDKPS